MSPERVVDIGLSAMSRCWEGASFQPKSFERALGDCDAD